MHCMVSILGGTRLSSKDRHAIHAFLTNNGYAGDDFGYYSTAEDGFVTLYVIAEPEKEYYWVHDAPEVIWFAPLTEIIVRSERNMESHNECYRIAKEIAVIIMDCIIYDHQIGVVYDPDGNPYAHSVVDGHANEYGAGINVLSQEADKREGHDERTPENI
jgi:hypothetical protein